MCFSMMHARVVKMRNLDSGSETEGVMELEGVEDSDDSEEDEMNSDVSDLDGDEEEEEEEDMSKAWGRNKKSFYSTDYIDELDSDVEAAEEEEKEVERLQAKQAEMLDEDDLGLDDSILNGESKTASASADSKRIGRNE